MSARPTLRKCSGNGDSTCGSEAAQGQSPFSVPCCIVCVEESTNTALGLVTRRALWLASHQQPAISPASVGHQLGDKMICRERPTPTTYGPFTWRALLARLAPPIRTTGRPPGPPPGWLRAVPQTQIANSERPSIGHPPRRVSQARTLTSM